MANKEITLGVGSLGIGGDLSTFSLYHTAVSSSNLIQANISKATIIGGAAAYDVDESLFNFIVVDDVYGGRQNLTLPAPTIDTFSPISGETGDSITIVGSGFAGVTAVKFGGTAAASFTKTSNTSISATVGAGSTGQITVTSPKGTATSENTFLYQTDPSTTIYFLGRFGYDKSGPTGLCSSPNSYPSYNLYSEYDSLSAAANAGANIYLTSDLTGFPPYGWYVLRLDSYGPTTDDIGFAYEINLGVPVTKQDCSDPIGGGA